MPDETAPADTAGRTMHIGELAERTGLSLRSLRHWDELGLMQASGRSEGGFRLYTEADERRVRRIMSMKPFGFSLDEIAELVDAIEQSPDAPFAALPAERATYFRTEMRARRDKLARQLAAADELLQRVDPSGGPTG